MGRSRARWWAAGTALASAVVGAAAAAQPCRTTTSRVGLDAFGGDSIRSLRITRLGPDSLPGAARVLDRLHVATREGTVRRELLFAPGDPVDPLAVAESLRRLRALDYLEDARIEARRCPDSAGVALTVVTRDARSERPIVKARPSSLALGLAEANAFGTGRGVSLALQAGAGGVAATSLVRDPALAGTRLVGELGLARYPDGGGVQLDVQPRAHSLADAWIGDLRVSASEREVVRAAAPGGTPALDRTSASLLAGRRVTGAAAPAAVYLLAGAEREQADVARAPGGAAVGPDAAYRSFLGVDVGVARRALRFDTLTWLLPHAGLVDVPRGAEGELVVAGGRDAVTGAATTHVDAWAGRVWRPGGRSLVVGDAWASGYAGGGPVRAATVRASLFGAAPAAGGQWQARLAAERLIAPDPSVRALAAVDPAAALLPRAGRLAEGAVAASVERSLRLRDVTRSERLDAALFGALSYRWDPATPAGAGASGVERLGAAFVGAGLRLAPGREGRATVRLDVGYPVWRVGAVPRRPVVGISVTPWALLGRARDGRSAR